MTHATPSQALRVEMAKAAAMEAPRSGVGLIAFSADWTPISHPNSKLTLATTMATPTAMHAAAHVR